MRTKERETPTSETVSDIFNLVTTTASLLLAIDETVTLFSMSEGLAPVSTIKRWISQLLIKPSLGLGMWDLIEKAPNTYPVSPCHKVCSTSQLPSVA